MTQKKDRDPKPPKSTDRAALVVLGMHRSGTSALTGVLGHMGCDLPQNLLPATEMNAKGYFESGRVTALNDALLASVGLRWSNFQQFPEEWFTSPMAGEFAEQAVAELVGEYGSSELFLMKDPRICRLVPFWEEALQQAGCNPLYVHTHRHPLDVAASLERSENQETSYGMLLWLRYVLNAEADTRGKTRVFTSYDQLMSDWAGEMRSIGQRLGLEWPRTIETAAPQVEEFLSPELRHFSQPESDAGVDPKLPDWMARTFQILERWVRDGEAKEDYVTLDEIRTGLDQACQSFEVVAINSPKQQLMNMVSEKEPTDLEKTLGDAEGLRQALARSKDETTAAQASHAISEKCITELIADLERTRGDAEGVRQELARSKDETAAAQALHATSESRSAEVVAELARSKDEMAAVENRCRDLITDVKIVESKFDYLQEAHKDLKQLRSQLRSELEQRRQETDDMHRQHIGDVQQIARLEEALKAADRRYDDQLGLVQSTKEKLEAAKSERKEHLEKLTWLREVRLQAQKTQTMLDNTRLQRGELERRLEGLEHDLREMHQGAEVRQGELEHRLSESEAHRQALLESTSWRMMAPVRWVVLLLRPAK